MVGKGLSILCMCKNVNLETLFYALYHDVKYVFVI